jgi:uncharacterized LabA/DUF88 family protein
MVLTEPKAKRAIAFFDGQNLYRHAKAAFGHHHPNYDVKKLFAAVCVQQGWIETAIRFYTGTPSHAESPMWHGYWSNRLLGMRRVGIHVTSRPIRYHQEERTLPDGSKTIVTSAQEKGIDIRLALDIVRLARQGQYDVAVLFSQDQDLTEVVEEVKEISHTAARWMKIACAFPVGDQATSKRGIEGTDWIRLDAQTYNSCLDPHDYRPKSS